MELLRKRAHRPARRPRRLLIPMVGALLALAGFDVVRRAVRVTAGQAADPSDRWLVVTVNRPPEDLRDVHDSLQTDVGPVEVEVRPAPGGKGTELAARLMEPQPKGRTGGVRGIARRVRGNDPRQAVRRALREAKSVLETGEVLETQSPGSTEQTLRGLPLELATRRAGGEGQL